MSALKLVISGLVSAAPAALGPDWRDHELGELVGRASALWGEIERDGDGVPEVIATGVDSLVFTMDVALPDDLTSELEQLQRAARSGALSILDRPGLPPLEVLPFGSRAGYRWLLHCEGLTVGLSDLELLRGSNARVEVGAVALWSEGAATAFRWARDVVRGLTGTRHPHTKVSRIDYAIDFQGWEPSDFVMLRMITRAVRRRAYLEDFHGCLRCGARWVGGGRYCNVCGAREEASRRPGPQPVSLPEPVVEFAPELYWDGLRYTGARWGQGEKILVRLYDKTLELEQQSPEKIPWMRAAWGANWLEPLPSGTRPGLSIYDPARGVWRLELQLRRKFLHKLLTPALPDGVETVDDALEHADSIVRYLLGAPGEGGWISLRTPNANPQRTRWPVSRAWQAFQSVRFEGSMRAAPAARAEKRRGHTVQLARLVHGCAAGAAANLSIRDRLIEKLRRAPSERELWSATMEELRTFFAAEDDAPSFDARVADLDVLRRDLPMNIDLRPAVTLSGKSHRWTPPNRSPQDG